MQDETSFTNKAVDSLKKENEALKIELAILRATQEKKEQIIEELIHERTGFRDENQKAVLQEATYKAQFETLKKTVDELAHTIHTDIFIATETLLELDDSKEHDKILAHIREVNDLTDLTLWFLRKEELYKKDDKSVKIDLKKIIENQLQLIKNAPSTLRLSTRQHKDMLQDMEVPVSATGGTSIEIPSEIKKVFNLLFKDLIRNAFKNTISENPQVNVKISEESDFINAIICNNKLMPENFAEWLTTDTMDEPEISKHSKAGLRILKKWTSYLKIGLEVSLNEVKGETEITLKIPKIITLQSE